MPARIAPIAFLLAAAAAFATHGCGKSRQDERAQQIAARVRTEFLHAWNNYERYAWGHDALRPLSKTAHDWYGQSLLMTPTDSPATPNEWNLLPITNMTQVGPGGKPAVDR